MGNREKVLNEDFRSVTNMSAANKAANGNMGNNPELKQRMEQLRLQREIVGVLITSF